MTAFFSAPFMMAATSQRIAPRLDSVTITGSGQVGSPLTAHWTGYRGFPADTSPAYQWTVDNVPLSGETTATFMPLFEMSQVRVAVSLNNGFGGVVERTSDPVAVADDDPLAPVIASPGVITGEGGPTGKIGYPHFLAGRSVTGDGPPAVSTQWNRDTVAIVGGTSDTYVPGSDDNGTTLTATVTASNTTDSVSSTTAGQTITWERPVALLAGTWVWSVAEDSGPYTFDAKQLFSVHADPTLSGCTFSLVTPVTGLSINSGTGILTQTGGTAVAATVTVQCSNTGGDRTNTISHEVVAPPITAPTIAAIADQTLSISSTPTTIQISTTGTGPFTQTLIPKAVKPTIRETVSGSNIYGADCFYGGPASPVPTLARSWLVDGVATGRTGDQFDNTTPAFGNDPTAQLTLAWTVGANTVTSDPITITGADLGGEVPPPEETVTPVLLGVTITGNNSASASWDATNPAYSAGDLVVVGIGCDRQASQITPVTLRRVSDGTQVGPSGETLVQAQTLVDTGVAGTSGNSASLWYYIAANSLTSGANLRAQMGQANNDIWTVGVAVWQAGTFDPDDPLDVIGTSFSGTAVANVTSAAGTVTNAQAKVCLWTASDVDRLNPASVPGGWTYPTAPVDHGNQAGGFAVRTSEATASESLSAVSFPLAASNPWVAITFVVNPTEAAAPPGGDWSEYESPTSNVAPVFMFDFDDEVYLRIPNGGTETEEVANPATIISNFTSIQTIGSTTGLRIGAGLTPRFALDQIDFNETEGSLVVTFECNSVGAGHRLLDINDGSVNNCVRIYADAGTTWKCHIRVGGVMQADLTAIAVNTGAQQTIAFGWKAADFCAVAEGGAVAATTGPGGAGTVPSTVTTACIGSNNGTGNQPEGVVKRLTIFDQKLPNVELDTMSGA
jgi:hypothetical protein